LESQSKVLQASAPKARVGVSKNAGHALFVDDAEHFNKVLAEFVNSLTSLSDESTNQERPRIQQRHLACRQTGDVA
jgi:hypothetical protein